MKISDTNRQLLQVFSGTLSVALMLLYAFPMAADGNAAVLVAVYFGIMLLALLRQSATLVLCSALFGLLSILTYSYINGFALTYFGLIPINTPMILLVALLSALFSQFFLNTSHYWLPQTIEIGFQLNRKIKWQVLTTVICTLLILLYIYPELLDPDYDGLYGTKSNRLISEEVRERLNTLYQKHRNQRDIKLPLSIVLQNISWDKFCGMHPYMSRDERAPDIQFRDYRISRKWEHTEEHQHFLFIQDRGNTIPIDMETLPFSQIPCELRTRPFSLNIGDWKPRAAAGGGENEEEVILSLENKPSENITVPSSGGVSR